MTTPSPSLDLSSSATCFRSLGLATMPSNGAIFTRKHGYGHAQRYGGHKHRNSKNVIYQPHDYQFQICTALYAYLCYHLTRHETFQNSIRPPLREITAFWPRHPLVRRRGRVSFRPKCCNFSPRSSNRVLKLLTARQTIALTGAQCSKYLKLISMASSYDEFHVPTPCAPPHAHVGAEVKIIITTRHHGRFWIYKATHSRRRQH